MAATTRWVQYAVAAAGTYGTGGGTNYGRGTRAYTIANASVDDSFNIGSTNNRLYVNIDGVSDYITLASGSDLDPRFVAKDISEKLHNLAKGTAGYDQAQCVWENNKFVLYAGSLGSSSTVTVSSGTNTAHLDLGWGSPVPVGGVATANGNSGNYITVSGTYNGFFDETYKIVINVENPINTPSKGGSNTYPGVITTGGAFNNKTQSVMYVISIDATNGTTMGAGTGNVPTMSWTGEGSVDGAAYDDSSVDVELLYADYWYNVGSYGLMVKFSDDIFNTVTTGWTIVCDKTEYAQGTNTSYPHDGAKFIWGSTRGESVSAASTASTSSWVRLGSRGLYVKWTEVANAQAGDEYRVICTPPQPSSYNISNLNYGNVTVSTESPVKAVMFEIMSGAVLIDTVKFGLQADGNFSHHNAGNGDTYFRFGTVGPGNNAGTNPIDGLEWRTNVTAADIDSDTPQTYMYASKENLSVVSDADSSEDIGVSTYFGMVADPVWLNIKLGQSEVGANSTINYRIYFDYS